MYAWRKRDEEWAKLLTNADQIIVDKLEEELSQMIVNGKMITMPYIVARMFRLKALRPEKYRDKFKLDVVDSNLLDILKELRSRGKEKPPAQEEPKVEQE